MFGIFEKHYVEDATKSKIGEMNINENDDIELEIYCNFDNLELLNEGTENLKFKDKNNTYQLHIRSKDSAGRGINTQINHGASLKITNVTKIEGTNTVTIPIPANNAKDTYCMENKIGPQNKLNRIKSEYSKVIKFAYDNRVTLNSIWNATDENEFNQLIDKLVSDNKNLKK